MDEFKALVELLGMLVWHPGTGVLMALLLVAALIDWRTMRIPNWLTVSGMVYGLVFNAMSATSITAGLSISCIGLATGLLLLLPLYLIRVLGAGDVKLMAVVGAFVGAVAVLKAALFVLIVGGIAAIAFAFAHQAGGRLANNMRSIVYSMVLPGVPLWKPGVGGISIGRLPYGISICAGTVVYLVARQLGYF